MSDKGKWDGQSPARLGALARLPLFFALEGRRAVIAGASAAAAWKAELLSASGAEVDVYCAEVSGEMGQITGDPPRGRIAIHRREWSAADLRGAALAIGDFPDDKLAAAFSGAARAAGVPVNVIDRPAFCDFSFGAIVNRSPLVIGISTDGAAPAFAQAIRGKLEAILPRGFAQWAAAAARWRSAVKASGLSFAARRKFWRLFAARAMTRADRDPRQEDFNDLIDAAGRDPAAAERGSITTVSLDRNDPGSLTLRGIRALQAADAVLFDHGIPHEVLDFARREARKIPVAGLDGNTVRHRPDIDALAAGLAREGRRVVRLTSDRVPDRRMGTRRREGAGRSGPGLDRREHYPGGSFDAVA